MTNFIHRRDFLTASVAAATAAGAIAAEGGAKIRTAVLGIQHSHLAGKLQVMRRNPDFEVVAVCEPDAALRRKRAADPLFNNLKWMTVDELVEDRSIDLVVFEGEVKDAVPTGKLVLESNKHLHLEKPPTNELEPFRALADLARRRNRRLQLGYLWRFHPGTDLALEAYRKGWLGDVYLIQAVINSDRDATQRAIEGRYEGGTMFELGGHMIDRIVAFLGRPDRVRSWLHHDTRIADSVKDNTLAVFEYPRALATVVSSSRDPVSRRSFTVMGSEGSITIDPMEPASVARIHLRTAQGPYAKGPQEVKFPPRERFAADFENLAQSIKSATPLRYSYDHELLLHETLLRASGEIASERGQPSMRWSFV